MQCLTKQLLKEVESEGESQDMQYKIYYKAIRLCVLGEDKNTLFTAQVNALHNHIPIHLPVW